MALAQLIYASRPFGFSENVLAAILMTARRCNERDDITGALICRQDLYLQLLEGPKNAVDATYARIAQDDRHLEVRLLSNRMVEDRLFPGWAMRDDPARSWMWTREEVDGGIMERVVATDAIAVMERLARETSS